MIFDGGHSDKAGKVCGAKNRQNEELNTVNREFLSEIYYLFGKREKTPNGKVREVFFESTVLFFSNYLKHHERFFYW